MNASGMFKWPRPALAFALAGACAACSSVDALLPSHGQDARTIEGVASHSPPTKDADKIVRLPMTPDDLDCPEVEVEDGAAATRVGGPDNAAVRYQFDIVDTARECQPQGAQFNLKVGVNGHLLIGPAGSPGAYSTSLKVLVRREVDQKTVFEKSYKVAADTTGGVQAPYEVVTEPIVLPLTRPQLNDDYSIFVGFDNGRNVALERPRHRRKPKAAAEGGAMTMSRTLQTPLHALHLELGARMAPFAGYDMPIQYRSGILAEHLQTRARAGLFDVSHMGQASLEGPDHETVARALEALCPADLVGLAPGRQRYTELLNADGGIVDDLMATRPSGADGRIALVVNASRKADDYALLRRALPNGVSLVVHADSALIALQGPAAAGVLARLAPESGVAAMPFMSSRRLAIAGFDAEISRSGYTGEDGYEISLPAFEAEAFARLLLRQDEVEPIGLGARDTLRLEAGLCLYGHELDETIDPIEAGLAWSIQKRRRVEGGFPGAARMQAALAAGPARKRVGLRLEGRAPARDGAEIVDGAGVGIGKVTSGGFGPSVGAPIAMGYVASAHAAVGTPVGLVVRGKVLDARVAPLPFHPHAYFRG